MLQPVKRRIKGSLLDLQRVLRNLLDAQKNAIAMQRPQRNRFQNQHVQGSLQQIHLPEYIVTRGAVFLNKGPWSFRVNANNIFDERYYTPQFLFWDVFISPSIGPTVDATISYKW